MEAYISAVLNVAVCLFGLCVGSFLNVVIYRVPNSMSIVKPASHCTSCGKTLTWRDNIPLFSYLALRGRCRFCSAKISPRYFAVELGNMVLWLICLQIFMPAYDLTLQSLMPAIIAMAVCSVLICVAIIDLENMWIPDRFHVIILGLAIAAAYFGDMRLLDRVLGCVGSLVFFLGLFYGTILFMKREGLGGGDVKLMAAAGLLLGWRNSCVAIFIAAFSACAVMLPLQGIRKRKVGKPEGEEKVSREFPFGPFLCAGILIAFLAGEEIMNAYLGLFGL